MMFCTMYMIVSSNSGLFGTYCYANEMQMRLIAIQTLLNFGVMTDTIADTHGPSVTKNANCC